MYHIYKISSMVYIKANVTVHSSIYVLLIYSASASFSMAVNAIKQKGAIWHKDKSL